MKKAIEGVLCLFHVVKDLTTIKKSFSIPNWEGYSKLGIQPPMSSVKVKFEPYLTWTPFVDFGSDSIPFWFCTVLGLGFESFSYYTLTWGTVYMWALYVNIFSLGSCQLREREFFECIWS